MNDTPFGTSQTAACTFRQINSLPAFRPPRTLLEAIDAAREAAQAEVLYYLPDDTPAAKLAAVLEDGSVFTDAESVAGLELAAFLAWGEGDELTAQIAVEAVNLRIAALGGAASGELETVTTTDIDAVVEAPLADEEEEQPDDQLGALLTAITDAFASVCEYYGYMPMPVGVPFEAFSQRTHDRCVRRGRRSAFDILKPLLTLDAAAGMAEAIAEAAWQFRARELATPSSAFKAAAKPKLRLIGN